MTEKRKRNIIIGALCGVLLLMTVGYAAFSSILNIKGTTNISSNWDIRITNVESKNIVGSASNAQDPEWDNLTATFKTNLEVPGDSIEYDVTVENKGTLNAKLDKINMTASNNPAIKFTATGLTEGDKLNAGSSAILTVKVEYLTGVEVDNKNLSANLTVTLDYVQSNVGEGGITLPPASDTLIENVVTEGDGLYEDEYETGRYIYRGANPDNYITFNGEEAGWRIISVETDGTLKIVKNDSLGAKEFDVFGARKQENSSYCRDQQGCNAWGSSRTLLDVNGNSATGMPYKKGSGVLDLPTKESSLNLYLNNEYYDTLNQKAKSQIDNHLWNVGFVDFEYKTLETSIQEEKAYKWRGKIGAINPTDYIKSSTNENCQYIYWTSQDKCTNNYLQTNYEYWLISPYSNSNTKYSHYVWIFYPAGQNQSSGQTGLYSEFAYSEVGVRPALFLKSDISLSGTGTQTDPYIID